MFNTVKTDKPNDKVQARFPLECFIFHEWDFFKRSENEICTKNKEKLDKDYCVQTKYPIKRADE